MEDLDFDELIDNLEQDAGVLINRMYALIALISTEGIPPEIRDPSLKRIRNAADDLLMDSSNILGEIPR